MILPEPRGRERPDPLSGPRMLVTWFRGPDHFDRFNRYLASKGLELAVRSVVLLSLLAVTLVLVLLRFSESGVHNTVTSVVNGVLIAATVAMIVPFATLPVITRRWSFGFLVYAQLGATIGVFANRDPFVGLIECVVFVMTGGYIAYFHNARLQVAHLCWVAVVLALIGRQVAIAADPALAVALSLLIATGIVVIPFACQFVLSILGPDAESSDIDPLTGLLNRRGLQRAVENLAVTGGDAHEFSYVVVIVDVDDFKSVNDSRGHDHGDEVLRAVADELRACGGGRSLTARFGGDEFVLVDMIDAGTEQELEDRVGRHMRIVRRELVVTTSIGIAVAPPGWSRLVSDDELAELFRLADASMYRAKAAGGACVMVCRTTT